MAAHSAVPATLDPASTMCCNPLGLGHNPEPTSQVVEEETIIILLVWGRPWMPSPQLPCALIAQLRFLVPDAPQLALGAGRARGTVAAPGAPPACRPLPGPRSCHPPTPPPRAGAAAGHLQRNPGPGLLPRGVRRVTITTGRSPRRPPGRK